MRVFYKLIENQHFKQLYVLIEFYEWNLIKNKIL